MLRLSALFIASVLLAVTVTNLVGTSSEEREPDRAERSGAVERDLDDETSPSHTERNAVRSPPPSVVAPTPDETELLRSTMDPTSEAYDPALLVAAVGMDTVELANAEPRAASWADVRERQVRGDVEEGLRNRGYTLPVDVACRTSSCVVSIVAAGLSMDERDALHVDVQRVAVADVLRVTWEAGDVPRLRLFMLFGKQSRDPGAYRDLVAEERAREQVVEWLRQQR